MSEREYLSLVPRNLFSTRCPQALLRHQRKMPCCQVIVSVVFPELVCRYVANRSEGNKPALKAGFEMVAARPFVRGILWDPEPCRQDNEVALSLFDMPPRFSSNFRVS